jgi:rare lipoprotein A (peptidoglycan hydrolase)
MALCAAMAGAPALALMHVSAPPSSMPPHVVTGDAVAVSASAPEPPQQATGDVATTVPTVPPTTVAATTSTNAVAAVRPTTVRSVPSTTAPRRPTTTVKATPKPAATAAKPAPKTGSGSSGSGSAAAPSGRSQSGGATWYDAAPPGTCAHKTLPMGTVVTIHASNGNTAQCRVSDRGPYADGMIIDLAKDVFTQLAPLSQGVVQVTISW